MARFARAQNHAYPNDNLVRCAICPNLYRVSLMREMIIQVPGWPRSPALVCRSCWDPPQPRAQRIPPVPVQPPWRIQEPGETNTTEVHQARLTSLSPATGTAAFWLSNPTVTITGTYFTTRARARVGGLIRITNFISSTSLTFNLLATDLTVGTRHIDVWLLPPPTPADGNSASNTLDLVVT